LGLPGEAFQALLFYVVPVVGALVVLSQPRHPTGWIFLVSGTGDPVCPLDGGGGIAGQAQGRYAGLGAPEGFRAVIFEGPHAFPEDVRQQAYEFLDGYLK